jgi:hypothetical protein
MYVLMTRVAEFASYYFADSARTSFAHCPFMF